MHQAVVYFVQEDTNGWIKIGHSLYLDSRLITLRAGKTMRSGKPGKMTVLATVRAKPKLEKRYQEMFADDRVDGEWFRPSQRLMAFIREQNRHAQARYG